MSTDYTSSKESLEDGEIVDENCDNDALQTFSEHFESRQHYQEKSSSCSEIDMVKCVNVLSNIKIDSENKLMKRRVAERENKSKDYTSSKESLEDGEISDENYNNDDLQSFSEHFESRQPFQEHNDDYPSEEESSSYSEFDIVQGESILDKMLSDIKNDSKDKVRKGRVVDRENTELDFLLPKDLEEQLRRIKIYDDDRLEICGTVIHRIEDTQTITFSATKSENIMDLGTAIFDNRREMIGIIGYIFGKSSEMNYQVICKDVATCEKQRPGDKLYCAPGASGAYFRAPDAVSAVVDDSDEDFSDDEKERQFLAITPGAVHKTKKRPAKKNEKAKAAVNMQPFVVPSMGRPFKPRAPPKEGSQNYLAPPVRYGAKPFSQQPPSFFPFTNFPPPPNNVPCWSPQQQWPPRSQQNK